MRSSFVCGCGVAIGELGGFVAVALTWRVLSVTKLWLLVWFPESAGTEVRVSEAWWTLGCLSN